MNNNEVIDHLMYCDIANIISYIPIINMRLNRLFSGYENTNIASIIAYLNNLQSQINSLGDNNNDSFK